MAIILRLARQAATAPPRPSSIAQVNALCRSGVVLLSSHIEGYIEDLGEVALDRIAQRQLPKTGMAAGFKYYLSHDLIREIKLTSDPSRVVSKIEDLLRRDGHIWGPQPNFSTPLSASIFVGNFANPTHERIKKFFGRFGYSEYQRDLARHLGADTAACTNMIDQVVEQRNRIAHGDTVTIGTPLDLAGMIDLVKQYCRGVDYVVGNWFRLKGCPIR